MHIIIDGYNLIRQSDYFRRFERQSLEAGRNALIARLAAYKRNKGHKITVIFDGWISGGAMEERNRQGGIEIIYSRRGEKADDLIKRIAGNSSEETMVVSSDREISSHVIKRGATAISSPEFEILIVKAIDKSLPSTMLLKKDDEDESDRRIEKKGPSRRLPKAKRHLQAKIKKL